MKVITLAFLLSCLWHLIFLLFLDVELPKVAIYPKDPEVLFLGSLFKNSKPHLLSADVNANFLFLDSLFTIEEHFSPKKEIAKDILRPARRSAVVLKLKEATFNKSLDKEEYKLFSKSGVTSVPCDIELDQYSNPILVQERIMTADFKRDFENWFFVKSQRFYSALKKNIFLSSKIQ